MDWNPRKLWPTSATLLVALTSFANADDDSEMHNLDNRVSALENRKVSNKIVNPAVHPLVKNGVDLSLQGSALYWQASESGLDYALTWDNDVPPSGVNPDFGGKGTFHHPKFKWNWGFNLGAAIDTMHDGWDLFLDWTRFHTKKKHAHCGNSCPGPSASVTPFTPDFTSNPHAVVYPLFFPANLIPGPAGPEITAGCCNENIGPGYLACMDWRVRLDMIDLELGREFLVSKWLTLRPHAGLRTAWVRQRGSIHYEGNVISSNQFFDGIPDSPATTANFDIALKNNFWGIGPRAGLNGQWGLGLGFSLYSKLAASILLGHFKVAESQTPTLVPQAVFGEPEAIAINGSFLSFHKNYTVLRMITDLDLGVHYETMFADDRYGLMLQVGWQQHMFFSQNQLQRLIRNLAPSGFATLQNNNAFTPVTNQGDLSTQGVTFTAQFDF